ncbi:MAG: hypothetical protein ACXWYS_01000 [Gaiellaceae bacterium]
MRATAVVLAVLIACAAYELAVARAWISMGTVPGDGPSGEGWIRLAGLLAMIAGAVLASTRDAAAITLPLAAAAFVVARFYTYDDCYLPTLRRVSDHGTPSSSWIYTVVAAACVAATCALVRALTGIGTGARTVTRSLSAIVVILCAFTAVIEGTGH